MNLVKYFGSCILLGCYLVNPSETGVETIVSQPRPGGLLIVDDKTEDKFIENFPKEPETSAAVLNQTEHAHQQQQLDLTKFPDLYVQNSRIYGRASCRCGIGFYCRLISCPPPITDVPWTVGLVRAGLFRLSTGRKPFCAGSLINDRYIVTAAHCVDGQLPSGIRVWLNMEDEINNTTDRLIADVSSIVVHPGYSKRSLDHDIALIKLTSPLDSYLLRWSLSPICIPANNDNDFSNYNADVSGWVWNATSWNGPQATYVRYSTFPVMTNEDCNRDSSYADKISPNMLCAGRQMRPGVNDTCQGESGGPLSVRTADRDTLIGIGSWGYGCTRPNSPGVYTKIGGHIQWILENTDDAEYCEE